jgi:YgiT-type zinc finger domain-containing protein
MRPTRSDLPFKTADHTIVILKGLPVLQCESCGHYLIEDAVLTQVDRILGASSGPAELQIIAYAAEPPNHEEAPALAR